MFFLSCYHVEAWILPCPNSSRLRSGVCLGNKIRVRDRNRLDKLIKKCISVMGDEVELVEAVVK